MRSHFSDPTIKHTHAVETAEASRNSFAVLRGVGLRGELPVAMQAPVCTARPEMQGWRSQRAARCVVMAAAPKQMDFKVGVFKHPMLP